MKLRTKAESRLRKKFKNAKMMQGILLGRQIREERRMLKRSMSKASRKLDKLSIRRALDLMGE